LSAPWCCPSDGFSRRRSRKIRLWVARCPRRRAADRARNGRWNGGLHPRVLMLPLVPLLVLLPVLGLMLNGTSSVLYGTVPELTPAEQAERAFALFCTGTIGSGAISPVLYGVLGDWIGTYWAT